MAELISLGRGGTSRGEEISSDVETSVERDEKCRSFLWIHGSARMEEETAMEDDLAAKLAGQEPEACASHPEWHIYRYPSTVVV